MTSCGSPEQFHIDELDEEVKMNIHFTVDSTLLTS